jgi:hypothetical protein
MDGVGFLVLALRRLLNVFDVFNTDTPHFSTIVPCRNVRRVFALSSPHMRLAPLVRHPQPPPRHAAFSGSARISNTYTASTTHFCRPDFFLVRSDLNHKSEVRTMELFWA